MFHISILLFALSFITSSLFGMQQIVLSKTKDLEKKRTLRFIECTFSERNEGKKNAKHNTNLLKEAEVLYTILRNEYLAIRNPIESAPESYDFFSAYPHEQNQEPSKILVEHPSKAHQKRSYDDCLNHFVIMETKKPRNNSRK